MMNSQEKFKTDRQEIKLGAHYYLWYGKPTPPVLGMGDWESGYTNHPFLGEYNSRDGKVISQHIDWAKKAGIDFFVMEWVGPKTWEDITLKDYYCPSPSSSEIKFCIHYDSSFALNKFKIGNFEDQPSFDFNEEYSVGRKKGEKFIADFDYLADHYFSHPQYLKIDGSPVVMIYNVSAFRNVSDYFNKLRINMEKRGIKLFLIGDVVYWAGVKLSKKNLSFIFNSSPKEILKVFSRSLRRFSTSNYEKDFSLTKYFQAITSYNLYHESRLTNFLRNVDSLYQKFQKYSNFHNIYFVPSVMPAYNDKSLKGRSRPALERLDGKFYEDFWGIANKYCDPRLNIILVTSFNEWHEGTEIEPSREYDDRYLCLTKLFKNKGSD